ncbi:small lysine-rich protein 1 [Cololabis saira]|uniref:small lysine-rich protein 1 n=1 Tax=Cololabis saira TaxID=129043 RepID=UPI002AD1D443|nr:small lysine-rich protein 1 [Cololabis saira]
MPSLKPPNKSRKSKPRSSKSAKKSGNPKSLRKKSNSAKMEMDILSPTATENLYYIAHNAAAFLTLMGFGWPKSTEKKKKGTKQKRKK